MNNPPVPFPGLSHLVVLAGVAAGLTGCGGSDHPATYPVSGVIQYQGDPLANVAVTFTPWEGSKGRPAIGRSDESGHFTLTTYESQDGAIEGTHRVTVAVTGSESAGEPQSAEDYSVPPPPPFPKKYLTPSMSDIEISVPTDTESGEVVIDLKD